jgi:hypothetical protein
MSRCDTDTSHLHIERSRSIALVTNTALRSTQAWPSDKDLGTPVVHQQEQMLTLDFAML